jgi:hypothetical protein
VYNPVSIAERDGVHVGAGATAASNRMPSFARAARFGVRTSVAPYGSASCHE